MKKYLFLMFVLCFTSTCALAQNMSVADNSVYLILTSSTFQNACDNFAEWKRIKGKETYVATKNIWTDADVLSVINAYESEGDVVKYILFVGSQNVVPGHLCSYTIEGSTRTLYSDYYYECRGNTSNAPTIRCGRIPVSTNAEAAAVLNKIIAYEQSPTTNTDFYMNVICSAVFDARNPYDVYHGQEKGRAVLSSENICNYIENSVSGSKNARRIYLKTATNSSCTPSTWIYNNQLLAQGGYLPSFLYDSSVWTGSSADINDSINAGAFLMTYIGHGSSTTWENREVAYSFNSVLYSESNVSALTNTGKYPVLLSMSCFTGNYNETTDCPAEFFLKKANAGAVAVIAPFGDIDMGYTEYMTEGFVNALWPSPGINSLHPLSSASTEVGGALAVSKDWMGYMYVYDATTHQPDYLYREDTDYYNYQCNAFHLFGDPSMMIYTAQPTAFSNISVSIVGENIVVSTGDSGTRISFYTPECALNGEKSVESFVGSSATHWFNDYYGSVIVCVDKHNKIPYITEVMWEDVYGIMGTGSKQRSRQGNLKCASQKQHKEEFISIPEFSTEQDKVIYDLQGRRLNGEPERGMYIRAGKIFRK